MVERARTAPIGASRPRQGRAGVRGAAVAGLAAATGAAALTAVLLGLRTSQLADAGAWRVESAVELGVTAVGALVATWLAASAGVALACSAARAVGASWRTGERLVQRCAPAVVRRVLVLAIGAGVGLAGATGATAAAPVAPDAPVAVSTAPSDLGWAPTARGDATAVPHGEARAGTLTPAPVSDPPHAPHERSAGTGATPSTTSTPDTPRAPSADAGTTRSTADAGGRTAATAGGLPAATAGRAAPAPRAESPAPASDPTSGADVAPPEATATDAGRGTHDPQVPAGSAPSTGPTAPSDVAAGGPRTAAWSSRPADAQGASAGATPRPSATPAATTPGSTVVVHPGDTLWSIAARHLPAGADDATIAAAWPRWYAANVAVVGADPDVLLPGQVLTVPGADGTVAP